MDTIFNDFDVECDGDSEHTTKSKLNTALWILKMKETNKLTQVCVDQNIT